MVSNLLRLLARLTQFGSETGARIQRFLLLFPAVAQGKHLLVIDAFPCDDGTGTECLPLAFFPEEGESHCYWTSSLPHRMPPNPMSTGWIQWLWGATSWQAIGRHVAFQLLSSEQHSCIHLARPKLFSTASKLISPSTAPFWHPQQLDLQPELM